MNENIYYDTRSRWFLVLCTAVTTYADRSDRFIKVPEVNVGDFLITDENVYTVLEVHDMSMMAPRHRKWITIVDAKDVVSGKRIDVTADKFIELKDAVRVKGLGTVGSFKGGKNMKYDEIIKIIVDVYKDKNTEDVKKMLNDRYGVPYKIYITSDGVKTVTARYGEIVATARCHDDDEFDIFKGAKIALDRLEKAVAERKRTLMLDGWYNSLSSEKKQYLENRFKVKEDSHK